MRRLRILVASDVSPYAVSGGSERVLREQTHGLARRGHRVHLLAREVGGNGFREEAMEGVAITSFPVRPRQDLRFALSSIRQPRILFQALQRRVGFDLINLHQPFSALGILASSQSRGVRTVYTFHSPAFLEFRLRQGATRKLTPLYALLLRWLEKFCLNKADRIVVLSRFSKSLLQKHYGIGGDKVAVIPGGVDLERFTPKPEARPTLRAQLGCPPEVVLLLSVRNLVPRMGLDRLLHAMTEVAKTIRVLLLIGGEGPMGGELKELAGRLGLGSSVRLEGYIPDEWLPTYYQAADFFLLPSKELEGFGLVAVEALACGTPVLGTPVGAIPEVLGKLQPDLLFDGTDPEAIARGIRDQLKRAQADPRGYQVLRDRCRAYAVTRFGWDLSIDLLEQELLNLKESWWRWLE